MKKDLSIKAMIDNKRLIGTHFRNIYGNATMLPRDLLRQSKE